MKTAIALAALMTLSACIAPQTPARAHAEQRGEEIARANCGSCHAVGRMGDSAAPQAPPFRTLSQNYDVANLQEALAEGISVGHPAMPQFEFSPADVDALVAYLQSIQEAPPPPPQ